MLVDLLLDKDDGKVRDCKRDGLKPLVRIYAVPPTFEGDDSEDDDEVVQEEEGGIGLQQGSPFA